MHPIAHATIAATVITSALGAFVLCLLVFRYGFEPAEEESLEAKHRRYFVTRLGHAAGAVFFAITAGLAGIALGLPAPKVAEAPRPADRVAFAPAQDLATLREEHLRLGEVVHGLGQSVQGLGERVGRAEAVAQRLITRASETKVEDKPAPRRPIAPTPTSRPASTTRTAPVIVPAPRSDAAPAAIPVAVTPTARPSAGSAPQAGPASEAPQPSGMALAAAAPTPAPTPIPTPTLSAVSAPTAVAEAKAPTEPHRVVDRRPEPTRSFTSEAARLGEAFVRSFANATRTVRQFVQDLAVE